MLITETLTVATTLKEQSDNKWMVVQSVNTGLVVSATLPQTMWYLLFTAKLAQISNVFNFCGSFTVNLCWGLIFLNRCDS